MKQVFTIQHIDFTVIVNINSKNQREINKMMKFNELSGRSIRDRVDMIQLWEAWAEAQDRQNHSFRGSMAWEKRNGKEYLYNRKSGIGKSLGVRTEKTEKIYADFNEGKKTNTLRLKSLSIEMEKQAKIIRALGIGRLPLMASRILRALQINTAGNNMRVVGTNALYCYEALAGVALNQDILATGDIDLLTDDENKLELLALDSEISSLTRFVQAKIDKSFRQRKPGDFLLVNDNGYRIEFIRLLPSPVSGRMPGSESFEAGVIQPVPITGLQWLINAPAIDAVVLDKRGFPVSMRCPDPRYLALHKAWLAKRENFDSYRKKCDYEQAMVLFQLLEEKLLHLPFDAILKAKLPIALHEFIPRENTSELQQPSW